MRNGVREHASRAVTSTSQDQCGCSIIRPRSPHTRPRCELLLRGAHRTSPRAPQPQPKPAQHITQGHSCTVLLRVVTCCCWLLQVPVHCGGRLIRFMSTLLHPCTTSPSAAYAARAAHTHTQHGTAQHSAAKGSTTVGRGISEPMQHSGSCCSVSVQNHLSDSGK